MKWINLPKVTPEEKKLVLSCLLPKNQVALKDPAGSSKTSDLSPPPPLLVLVTVCEARMQAEILHGLEAVTQFMKSWKPEANDHHLKLFTFIALSIYIVMPLDK